MSYIDYVCVTLLIGVALLVLAWFIDDLRGRVRTLESWKEEHEHAHAGKELDED